MDNITKIINCIDDYLMITGDKYVTVCEAAKLLHQKRLLKGSPSKPGTPLRKLLRERKIPHAYQMEGRYSMWLIPMSPKTRSKKLTNQYLDNINRMTKAELIEELKGMEFFWDGCEWKISLAGNMVKKLNWLISGVPQIINLKRLRKATLIQLLIQAEKEKYSKLFK